jgi:uracil-DNA glycosylase family 4
MGFFQINEQAAAKEIVERKRPARAASSGKLDKDLTNAARGCEACGLRENWSWITTPQMPISGNIKDPDVLALGEAPGAEECRDGAAFVGDSGKMLRRAIPGRELDRVAYQNAVRCRPSRTNDTPSAKDVHACSIYLEEDIAKYNFKAILGIGSVPLQRYLPRQAITRIHGTRFPVQIGNKTLWYWPVLHPSFVLRSGGERSPAYAVFRSDIKCLFQSMDKWAPAKIIQPDPAAVIVPTSMEEAISILDKMNSPVAIDLETQNLRPYQHDSALLTAAISDGNLTMAFPIDHPETPSDWGLAFLLYVASERQWIAHNAIMELTWMLFYAQKHNIPFEPHDFDDSMACGRLYHARETILGLDILSRIHIGVDVKTLSKVNLHNMASEPLSKILPYNGIDAWASAIIVKKLRDKVKESNYQRLLGGIRSTAQMELMGLDIDEAASLALKDEWGGKAATAQQSASQIYEVRQFQATKQIEFNIASAQHVGDALVEFGRVKLPKTGKQWNTDEDTLRSAAGDNPLAMAALDYREASKQVSTYVEPVLAAHKNNIDHRLHPSYSTMLTATGRLSSESPNVQNFPKRRHRELRKQIVAPPDHLLVSFDYGQLEARVFGFASACKGLCPSIINKIDIHSKWRDRALDMHPAYIDQLALKTNETKEDKILKGGRDIIKSDFVFASFFGSTAEACADRTGMPLRITRDLLAEFWYEYPGVGKWVKARRQEYMDTGSITLLTGMERHAILWLNEPLNSPIQGTAAHLVIDAQNACYALAKEHNDPYLFPRINIHDDLTFILPEEPDLLTAYIEIIAEQLVAVRYPFQIVPLSVEVKVGKSWDAFVEREVFTGDYIR